MGIQQFQRMRYIRIYKTYHELKKKKLTTEMIYSIL